MNSPNFQILLFRLFVCGIFFLPLNIVQAADIEVTPQNQSITIGSGSYDFINTVKIDNADEVTGLRDFLPIKSQSPVYPLSVKDVWIKFRVKNAADANTIYFDLRNNNLTSVQLYKVINGKAKLLSYDGNIFEDHLTVLKKSPNIIFDLLLPNEATGDYLLHINSEHPIILPIFISTPDALFSSAIKQTLINGLYFGLVLVMLIYNLFLYLSTKDNNYLTYSVYILSIILAQLAVTGYGTLFVWSFIPSFNYYAVVFTSCFSGIAAVRFAMLFLHTKHYTPVCHFLLKFFSFVFVLIFLASLFHQNAFAYYALNVNSFITASTALVAAIIIARQGIRSAYFYVIAWFAFLISVLFLAMRNFNIVPYNDFTAYVFHLGTAIETVLLSFALADKINTYKHEKEASQAEALRVSKENEKIITEQNITLERKVAERTEELQDTNYQLNDALVNLKDAQTQLVDAEKMASLGQLTAGIAHEINNPINFVKSNIKPLQLDFNDLNELLDEYNKLHNIDAGALKKQLASIAAFQDQIDLPFVKKEITSLISGIEEGAERTAEIVRGLRTFSRLDEGELKTVDIHEGINSTLVLLKNSLPYHISLTREFNANGKIDCYPGKLNQVFMNIINNGIQAIQAKEPMSENESIVISTRDSADGRIIISIKDSGIGMNETVKQKIFEPFFTTKAVGEGTGLGMAIVFKIIEKHHGKIDIISSPGNGAEFILSLPHALPETS